MDTQLLQTIFYIAGITFFVVLGLFVLFALMRINRILIRMDLISKELVGPAKHLAKALSALQESAIVAGVAYFMKKAQEFMSNRAEDDHHNQTSRRVV